MGKFFYDMVRPNRLSNRGAALFSQIQFLLQVGVCVRAHQHKTFHYPQV